MLMLAAAREMHELIEVERENLNALGIGAPIRGYTFRWDDEGHLTIRERAD